MAWARNDAAHLLRRTGFGGSLADVEALFVAGQTGAIERLLNYEAIADPIWNDINPLVWPFPLTSDSEAALNLLYKLIVSKRPLQSRLLWFWHGHFTTNIDDAGPVLMLRQIDTWRRYAAGNFLEFLLAMWKDGAMLDYLNGEDNEKANPNENFARENWELFTMGTGVFTESDVREAARAFTGYEVNRDNSVHSIPTITISEPRRSSGGPAISAATRSCRSRSRGRKPKRASAASSISIL